MTSSSSSRSSLSTIGRSRFCSQSALASILQEVQRSGVPAATSRASVKRARDADIRVETPFGALFQELTLQLTSPAEPFVVDVVNPLAFLHHATATSHQFAAFVSKALAQRPSGPSSRWGILLYHDEVSPGNQLKHHNKRKVQAIYWSFREYGTVALSSEWAWATLAVVRSHVVNRLAGGMSELMAQLVPLFFQRTCDIRESGIPLHLQGSVQLIFADVGCIIADADALKQAYEIKGHNGTL
jgi:hypothetical protein